MKKYFPLVIFITGVLNYCFSGSVSKTDSLIKILKNTTYDTTRISILLLLGNINEKENPDTALYFLDQAKSLTEKLITENNKTGQLSFDLSFFLGKIFKQKGRIYYIVREYTEAVNLYYKALGIFQKIKKRPEIADCYILIGTIHTDNCEYKKAREFHEKAINICFDILKTETNKSEIKTIKKNLAQAYKETGISYFYESSFSIALEFFKKSFSVFTEINDKKGIAYSCGNIGNIYYKTGRYPLSLEYYHKCIAALEELNDKAGITKTLFHIGTIHAEQKDSAKAMGYFNKALELCKETNNLRNYALSYKNIGNMYYIMRDFNRALNFYEKELECDLKLADKNLLSGVYGNLGNIFMQKKNYQKAEESFSKTIGLFKEIQNYEGVGYSYLSLSELNIDENNLKKAIQYADSGLTVSIKIGNVSLTNGIYEKLSEIYEQTGNFAKSLEYYKLFNDTKDSLFSKEKNKQITEMDTKYQTEKKEQQIKLQQTQLEKKEVEAKQQKTQRNALIGGLCFFILLVFISIRAYTIKRKANIQLAIKNTEINQQKEEIQSQRDLVVRQRDLISEQNTEITKSIQYAFRIQSAVIPSEEAVSKILKDFFILYKPRDIVSGDFYWIGENNNKIIILAADCTGHGVPGAFMSMLGVAFLNEIVNKSNNTQPDLILNALRENIIKALKQHGKEEIYKDGMDVAVITLNISENKIQYAGANNPLYIIKNKKFLEFKGSRMPVGIYENMDNFLLHEIDVSTGDILYIFSDGFEDQFGGLKGKKFMSKQFKELLMANNQKPMAGQKVILEKTFESWRGQHEQVDDVMVIGVKI